MWLLPACERPPTDEPDGGGSDATLPVTGPDIPWLDAGTPPIAAPAPPTFTPCPTGWREVAPSDADGVATCEPFPEAGALECPDGEAHFPGEPGCAPIGAPCPAGEWPEGLPPDATVLFVRPGAGGGTGTREAPFGTVREAIAAAPDGATIALSRGLFTESVMVDRAVTVRGACARDTIITSPEIGAHLVAAGAALEDVSIRDTGSAGLAVYDTPRARVAGVLVERANVEGVLVAAATLDVRALVVRDTRPDGDGYGGAAIDVTDRAHLTMGRAILERSASYAAYVDDATLVASDVVLRDTRPQPADGRRGFGISVSSAGRAELTRALVERCSAAGVLARGAGTSLVMTDSVVREVRPGTGAGEDGMGISILNAARAELTRVRVAGATDLAIEAAGIDTVIAVSDGLLARSGYGAAFHTNASARATRLRVMGCGTLGVGVGSGAEGSLSDVSVSDTLAMSDVAVGVLVNGARAAFSRLAVERAEGVGVMATGASTVVLEDSTIRDTRWAPPGGDGFLGRGLMAQLGAQLDAERVSIERTAGVGISVVGADARVTLLDGVVRDSVGGFSDGWGSAGVFVERDASVSLSRVVCSRNETFGVAATLGGAIVLSDVAVWDTIPSACAATTCADQPAGIGAAGYLGGRLGFSRFSIARAHLCGVQVAREGELDLAHGEVAESAIGVCLQVEGYDVGRLTDAVRYRDNGATIEATTFPVPTPTDPIAL